MNGPDNPTLTARHKKRPFMERFLCLAVTAEREAPGRPVSRKVLHQSATSVMLVALAAISTS
jgi:hypothetical protein